ncbi:MAG: isoprenylcysteine carboxylmethyltransferase family protein [Sneathiellaceae bacterium]
MKISDSFSGAALSLVQRRRKVALLFIVFGTVSWAFLNDHHFPGRTYEQITGTVGIVLIGVCVLGRVWCSWFISGRKKKELVQEGPFSMSRNPLYMFSIIGASGAGLTAGSIVLTILIFSSVLFVFNSVVTHEENFLLNQFGDKYILYCATVPRWGIRMSSFSFYVEYFTNKPNGKLFLISIRDSSLFLLCIPLFRAIDEVTHTGFFRPVFALY